MTKVKSLPARDRVDPSDCWDLSSLYASDAAWEKGLRKLKRQISLYDQFRGHLAESAPKLAACLEFDLAVDRLSERVGTYAYLKTAEDQAHSTYQRMLGRYQHVSTEAARAASFLHPEIMAIPAATMRRFLAAPELAPYRLLLERILRYQRHTLSAKEEELLALQSEMAQVAGQTFRQLLDADLRFGDIETEQGRVELTNANFLQMLHSPSRKVRRTAFDQYYAQFAGHENTLAATLNGSIQRDIYYARARGYPSALESALFHDQMPVAVYHNLIETVHRHLPALHRYYELRRRKMRLRELHHYDTYVPILSELEVRYRWGQATRLILEALEPLGRDYGRALAAGLEGRWCDRYSNRGKQSGAFSCGTFDGDPYILMNYKPEVLSDVFTLAHEAGHSMHSHLSARHQPFAYYRYAIFVAEVASTFNEELLSWHLLQRAPDDRARAYLVNRAIDAIRGTIFRQTMFAEFEKQTHELAESGEPLTVETLKETYGRLLGKYFGPDFAIDPQLRLECLRIPHFYRAFYVYKYATGMSAAIALSQRVLGGGPRELEAYLSFLRAGCSKFPLELLRDAGVDMESPQPVDSALRHFTKLVDQLEGLL